MVIENPCGLCYKAVANNHRSIQCDICDLWIHIKCNNISPSKYEELMSDSEPWICIKCINSHLPFGQCNDKIFYINQDGVSTESNLENLKFSTNKNDKQLKKQICDLIIENTDPQNENKNFCKFYDLDKFAKSKFKSENNFSLLHLNIASLQFHIEDLKILLQILEYPFDIIAISETKIQKGTNTIIDINIPNYQYIHTPTESTKGGTLLYINNNLNSKPRTDLDIYQAKDVESTFAEIIIPKGKNIIIGCIYKHHTIDPANFGKLLEPTLIKVNKEKKPVIIAGDFNIDLLKFRKDKNTNDYFDLLTDNNYMPLITIPTRITPSSKTLIDNVLYNRFSPDIYSGNLTVSISDHSPQFVIIPIKNKISNSKKQNITIRDFKNLDYNMLKNSFQSIDWSFSEIPIQTTLESPSEPNVNGIMDKFLTISNSVIDNLVPLRKM